jgi:DNA polymerase I-like protein with 3'-5' exonuclease and polymerase domains
MRSLILDVETTISSKGNPFDESNKLCYVGLSNTDKTQCYAIEYDDEPYRHKLEEIQKEIDQAEILVGFNIKFDLHWLRKYGINFVGKRVWDCQLVHFVLRGQQDSYPSLNGVSEYYDLGSKLDVVATEYWGNKIDTPNIPKEILEEYLIGDLHLTQKVFDKQLEEFASCTKPMQRLISLHNQDLLVLEEMEYNGLLFDETKANTLAKELEQQIKDLDNALVPYHNLPEFNPSSNEQLSCLLYGGTIKVKRREVIGLFKTGDRKGQVKEKWVEHLINFDRRITPLKGSELDKEGLFSTDESTLKSLRGSTEAKELVKLILERATLEKRLTTYYRGLVELRTSMNWPVDKLHGQLNQCVARTGRLSSSKPNLQNFDGEIKQLFGSRYAVTS